MQVTVQLFDYATKFNPDGITVRVQVGSNSVDQLVLSVSDSGVGIPEEDRRRVFDLVHRPQLEQYLCGLSIGLFPVREIAERHLGVKEVDEIKDDGTRFVVRLPMFSAISNA